MGWLFRKRSKQAEEKIILDIMHHREVNLKSVVELLISRDEYKTNPHHNIPRDIAKRTEEIIHLLQKEKSNHFPIHIYFLNSKILIQGTESIARLRALRSTVQKKVALVNKR